MGLRPETSSACRWLVLLLILAFSLPMPGHAGPTDHGVSDATHCHDANALRPDVPGDACDPAHDGAAHGNTCCMGPACASCVPAAAGDIPIASGGEASGASPSAPHSGSVLYLPFRPPRSLLNA